MRLNGEGTALPLRRPSSVTPFAAPPLWAWCTSTAGAKPLPAMLGAGRDDDGARGASSRPAFSASSASAMRITPAAVAQSWIVETMISIIAAPRIAAAIQMPSSAAPTPSPAKPSATAAPIREKRGHERMRTS